MADRCTGESKNWHTNGRRNKREREEAEMDVWRPAIPIGGRLSSSAGQRCRSHIVRYFVGSRKFRCCSNAIVWIELFWRPPVSTESNPVMDLLPMDDGMHPPGRNGKSHESPLTRLSYGGIKWETQNMENSSIVPSTTESAGEYLHRIAVNGKQKGSRKISNCAAYFGRISSEQKLFDSSLSALSKVF